MRFGLMPPSFSFAGLDYPTVGRLRPFATRAEAVVFEAGWVAEHVLTARGNTFLVTPAKAGVHVRPGCRPSPV